MTSCQPVFIQSNYSLLALFSVWRFSERQQQRCPEVAGWSEIYFPVGVWPQRQARQGSHLLADWPDRPHLLEAQLSYPGIMTNTLLKPEKSTFKHSVTASHENRGLILTRNMLFRPWTGYQAGRDVPHCVLLYRSEKSDVQKLYLWQLTIDFCRPWCVEMQ